MLPSLPVGSPSSLHEYNVPSVVPFSHGHKKKETPFGISKLKSQAVFRLTKTHRESSASATL